MVFIPLGIGVAVEKLAEAACKKRNVNSEGV